MLPSWTISYELISALVLWFWVSETYNLLTLSLRDATHPDDSDLSTVFHKHDQNLQVDSYITVPCPSSDFLSPKRSFWGQWRRVVLHKWWRTKARRLARHPQSCSSTGFSYLISTSIAGKMLLLHESGEHLNIWSKQLGSVFWLIKMKYICSFHKYKTPGAVLGTHNVTLNFILHYFMCMGILPLCLYIFHHMIRRHWIT